MHADAGQRRHRRVVLLMRSEPSQTSIDPLVALAPEPIAQPVQTESVPYPQVQIQRNVEYELFEACNGDPGVIIRVEDLARRVLHEQPMDRPWIVIGQGADNDLWLEHTRILPRHAAVMWLNGGLFFMTLSPQAELFGPQGPMTSGWWPSNLSLRLGAFRLRIVGQRKAPPQFAPLSASRVLEAEHPHLELQIVGKTPASNPPWPITRPVTLIGRSSLCKIRLDHPRISPVQAALIRTAGRLWLINLAISDSALVNGKPFGTAQLDVGDQIQCADYRFEIQNAGEWTSTAFENGRDGSDTAISVVDDQAESASTNELIHRLNQQQQQLLELQGRTKRTLEQVGEKVTGPDPLRALQDLIRKTEIVIEESQAALSSLNPGGGETTEKPFAEKPAGENGLESP